MRGQLSLFLHSLASLVKPPLGGTIKHCVFSLNMDEMLNSPFLQVHEESGKEGRRGQPGEKSNADHYYELLLLRN